MDWKNWEKEGWGEWETERVGERGEAAGAGRASVEAGEAAQGWGCSRNTRKARNGLATEGAEFTKK